MKNIPDRPAMIVSLHDVSPHTWADYRPLLAALDDLPDLRLTQLLVPDFHGHGRIDASAEFCRQMDRRVEAGDELVLHGYRHCDEGPPPRTPGAFLRRRILTHEAEFASLDREQAARRLNEGRSLFRRCGWPLEGFVPPGWQMNETAARLVAEQGFRWTADGGALYRLPEWQRLPVPTLVWSARSAWRRGVFHAVNATRLWRWQHAPVIRLALHPVDLRHRRSFAFWLRTIRLLHGRRRVLTKGQWLEQAT